MDLSARLRKLKGLLEGERKAFPGSARKQPVPSHPTPASGLVELRLDRDSVCMGDDLDTHKKTIQVDPEMKLSALLKKLAGFVPSMGSGAVWSVRAGDHAVGYILGGGMDAETELAGEDVEIRKLPDRWINCAYYHAGRFSWTDGKTGKPVESFPECSTLLEKVKMKEGFWAESCDTMADISSKDPKRIWSGVCEIVHRGQDPDWIRHFFYRVEDIERATRGVELGGGIAPNSRFVDYAIKTIQFHKEGRGCPCGLYPMVGEDCLFDPLKEEEKGCVQILDTVQPEGSRFVEHYLVKCTRCGQTYRVTETVGHWKNWKWLKMPEK